MDEMDSHRRKSLALLTRKGADGRCELDDGEPAPSVRASRSFSKVAPVALLQITMAWESSVPVARCLDLPCEIPCIEVLSVSGEAAIGDNKHLEQMCCVEHS